jgi:hypothetical protein
VEKSIDGKEEEADADAIKKFLEQMTAATKTTGHANRRRRGGDVEEGGGRRCNKKGDDGATMVMTMFRLRFYLE